MSMAASSEFSRVFAAFDQDGNDKISTAELRLCMKEALGSDMSADSLTGRSSSTLFSADSPTGRSSPPASLPWATQEEP